VLLVTGYEEKAESRGSSRFQRLIKPFELEALASKIRDMLETDG